jgi:pyruvate dehydrogenase E1 component beta subunit
MVIEALRAADFLSKFEIEVEVIDLRSIKPLDEEAILDSVKKTGRLIVADTSWINYGVSSEIAALVAEKGFKYLSKPVKRIGLPNCPAPSARILEEVYYPNAESLKNDCLEMLDRLDIQEKLSPEIDNFKGPY